MNSVDPVALVRLAEAARAAGVSLDEMVRAAEAPRVRVVRDADGRIAAVMREPAPLREGAGRRGIALGGLNP